MPPETRPEDGTALSLYHAHIQILRRIVSFMLDELEYGVSQLQFYRDPKLTADAKKHLPKLYGSSNAITMGLKLADLVERVHTLTGDGKEEGAEEEKLTEEDCEAMERYFARRRELGLPLLRSPDEKAPA